MYIPKFLCPVFYTTLLDLLQRISEIAIEPFMNSLNYIGFFISPSVATDKISTMLEAERESIPKRICPVSNMLSCTKRSYKFPQTVLWLTQLFFKDMSCLIPNSACVLLYRITILLSNYYLILKLFIYELALDYVLYIPKFYA